MEARTKPRMAPQIIQGMPLGTLWKVLSRNDLRVDTACLGRLAYLVVLGVLNTILGGCELLFQLAADRGDLELETSRVHSRTLAQRHDTSPQTC